MTTVIGSPYTLGDGSIMGDREKYARLAVQRLRRRNLFYFFDDFLSSTSTTAPNGWQTLHVGGTSSMLAPNNRNGGICTLSTGAVANQQAGLSTIAQQSVYQSLPFWFAGQIKITGGVDATTTAAILTNDSAGGATIGAGVFGANSTVSFSLQHSGVKVGTYVTSSPAVAVDALEHTFELWGQGNAQLYWAIDGGAEMGPYTITVSPTQFQNITPQILNGAGGVNRTMECNWLACAGVR